MGRSQGFASTPADYFALFRLAFASASCLKHLTLPTRSNSQDHYAKGTPSTVKQCSTACRHTVSGSFSLPYSGFFSPFLHSTSSLSVSQEYLALSDGSDRFRQDSTCPALLRVLLSINCYSCTGLSPPLVLLSSRFHLTIFSNIAALQPQDCRNNLGLGSFHFARRYYGNHYCFLLLRLLRCFSSARSLPLLDDISSICQVSPFRHLRIKSYLPIPAAFRSLSRLSSPLRAQAFPVCPQ